jgi:NADH-quinone oxidoreductase subunit F
MFNAVDATPEVIALLEKLCEVVRNTSLCGLGQSAPNPVTTTLKYFRKEYIEHIHDKRCRSGVCEELTKSGEDRKKTEKPEEVHA